MPGLASLTLKTRNKFKDMETVSHHSTWDYFQSHRPHLFFFFFLRFPRVYHMLLVKVRFNLRMRRGRVLTSSLVPLTDIPCRAQCHAPERDHDFPCEHSEWPRGLRSTR